MTRHVLKLAGLLLATTGASAALAHDFFLMPQNFRMSGPGEIDVQATVSSDFPRAANVVTADRVAATEAQGPGQPSFRVADALPKALNLKLTASREGLIAAAVRTVPRDVEYTEDRIGIILEEYNVGPAAKAAVERLSAPRTLRVSSRRFAKTLVCAVRCSDWSPASKPFGVDLEFVPADDDGGRYELLAKGVALPNHPVDLVAADGKRTHLRSDAKGQISLPVGARGATMLFAAVMTVPQANERFTLDLTSLTLQR